MTSLRSLLAAYEGHESPTSASIDALEKMVRLQRSAYDQALADLTAARARQGLPLEPTDLPQPPQPRGSRLSAEQVAITAANIVRMGQIRRGELAPDMPPVIAAGEAPKTAEGSAAIAAAIIMAGKKRRGEKES